MSTINVITKNLSLPLSDLITRQSVSFKLKFLQKSQWFTRAQIDEYQNMRLRKLIEHSIDTVPYYKNLFNKLGFKASDIRTKENLNKLPLLTKSIIRNEGIENFLSSSFPKIKTMNSSSSGSTGEPLFYTTTKEAYSMNIAANLRGWYWIGYRLGDKYLQLSQNSRKAPLKRLQDFFNNNLYLATNPLVDSNFEFILQQIEKYKPKIIRCYPDPLLMLARYKRDRQIFTYTPHAIATTGNTLFPETRQEIEDAFGCKIFDAYSCEGNSTVFECPTHTGYHSAEEYGISEVIDNDGNQIKKGIGRLVSTDLWNLAHPFIRYDTQDLVEIDSEPCSCGRSHLKIIRIIGRDNDILKMTNGRYFIVHNFTGFFQTDLPELKKSIDQFQVINIDKKVIFKLVVNINFDESVADFIKCHWEKEMQTPIEIQVVDYIPLTQSGKRKFIINDL